MLNKIILQGRMTKQCELRYTQNQKAVGTFSLAVERDFSKEKQTDFFNIVVWGNTAEFVSKYTDKGSMVIVSGRLTNREWNDSNGNKRITTEIVADNVYFAESKRKAVDVSAETFEEPKQTFTELTDAEDTLPF